MKDRPPDPHQNNPLSNSSNFTDGNLKCQPADATLFESTAKSTSQTIAIESPLQATINLNQNQSNIDRPINPSHQQTPTYVVSLKSTEPSLSTDHISNSGEPLFETKGSSVYGLNRNQPQTNFPKLTSNFDRPGKSQIANATSITKTHPPPVRHNVQQTTEPPPFIQKSQTVIPTIQQLQIKYNDHTKTAPSSHQPSLTTQPNAWPKIVSNANNSSPPNPPNITPSFATRLRASQSIVENGIAIQQPLITTKQGFPAVLFDRNDFMVKLASSCRFTLIGKFATTMPKLEVIRKSLTSQLQIKGNCKVTHFNSTHVYIDLENEVDHSVVWNKERIYIGGRLMRLLVWTPTFRPEEETPITPVWLVLPQLPWHCYTIPFVTKLLEPVGKVLYFDAASIQRSRGSVAKVKIEIDLTKSRPPHIWLGFPQEEGDVYGEGRWQELQFEDVPEYCQFCKHQGHSQNQCKAKFRDEEYQKKKREEEMSKEGRQQPVLSSKDQAQMDNNRQQQGMGREVQMQASISSYSQTSNAVQKNSVHESKRVSGKPPVVKHQYVAKTTKLPLQPSANLKNQTDVGGMRVSGEIKQKLADDRKSVHLFCKNGFEALTECDDDRATTGKIDNLSAKSGSHNSGGVKENERNIRVAVENMKQPYAINHQVDREARDSVAVAMNLQDAVKLKNSEALTTTEILGGFVIPMNKKSTAQVVKQDNAPLLAQVSAHYVGGIEVHDVHDGILSDAAQVAAESALDTVTVSQALPIQAIPDAAAVLEKMQPDTVPAYACTAYADTVPTATCHGIVPLFINDSVQGGGPSHDAQPVQPTADKSPSKSTKEWILKSFYGSKQGDEKNEQHTGIVHQVERERKTLIKSDQNAKKFQESKNDKKSKTTVSITSQDNFANIMPLGSDNDEIESNMALTVYVPPNLSGNTLIPTTTLEAMCKQASKVRKEVGKGCFPVKPKARFDIESQEVPTYFLGDLFEDSQMDQNEPSKDVKSKWNLNAPLFIPSALRQQEPQVPIEIVDSQYASDLFPTGPSDEVLLQRLNLHDTRGLLQRQSSPPQDLPQKFSSPHPGIIEDGSEYEEDDEDSTAYNDMVEARYAGLSPRVEQACKPKLIKKKRRPLEPKKKEAAPKKQKRVQPTRSSKTRSSRRK